MSTVTRVVATQATLGPLITLTGVNAAVVNSLLAQAEAGQPEGALMQLTVQNLGVWASPVADRINSAYTAGQIVYQPTGEKIQPWPGTSVIATVPQSGVVQLRWVKLQWFVPILIGLAIGVLVTYLALRALHDAPYTMTSTVSSSSSPSGTSGAPPFAGPYHGTIYLFWLPWYWDLGIAGVLALGPWIVERLSQGEWSLADLLQGHKALEEAER